MKKVMMIIGLATLVTLGVSAHANTVSTNEVVTTTVQTSTNAATADDSQSWELTLGAGGLVNPKTSAKQGSIDVSLETNPFKSLTSLWVGGEQSISWTPTFVGYSDIFAEWSFDIWKEKLYLNPGWDLGVTYAPKSESLINTGPHVSLQYFLSNDVFTYGQINYDIESHGDTDQNNVRFSAGIGWSF